MVIYSEDYCSVYSKYDCNFPLSLKHISYYCFVHNDFFMYRNFFHRLQLSKFSHIIFSIVTTYYQQVFLAPDRSNLYADLAYTPPFMQNIKCNNDLSKTITSSVLHPCPAHTHSQYNRLVCTHACYFVVFLLGMTSMTPAPPNTRVSNC